jgi:methionyl-tRNA formyltransferase
MRIIFAGSPSIALPSLKAVSDMELAGHKIALAGVLTNQDRPRRHGQSEPTDVSAAAYELDRARTGSGFPKIPQLKPEKLDGDARKEVAALSPDLLVSFAYGRLFGPRFLALFPLGGVNIHPSLLPKYRGASPIPAVIMAREKETGICIQKLAEEMDSGGILAMESIKLSGRETTRSLSEIVAGKAALLLRELLIDFKSNSANAKPQEDGAVYCREIKKEDGLIDWKKSALDIDAMIRAFTPWPLSYTRRGEDTLIILEAEPLADGEETSCAIAGLIAPAAPGTVLGVERNRGIQIQTGSGILIVTKLQWQAKKPLDWKSFCNGERGFAGTKLG